MPLIDLTNQVFGKLTVKKRGRNKPGKKGGAQWWCECSCGFSCVLVSSNQLRTKVNPTRTCGSPIDRREHALRRYNTDEDKERRLKNHLDQIKTHGRVQLIGEFKGVETKTKYRCLIHDFTDDAFPYNMNSGQGLECCRSEKLREENARRVKLAIINYKKLINGRFILKEKWKGSGTPIDHYCIKHQQTWPAAPTQIQGGSGLKCCGIEKEFAVAHKKRDKAKAEYDDKIAVFGRVLRVDEYQDYKTNIDHYCLRHDETHPALPSNIKKGQGLKCCYSRGFDCINDAINGTLRVMNDPEWLYLFELKRFPEYIKLGIATEMTKKIDVVEPTILRDKDPEYGEAISLWFFEKRIDAYLVEEALFFATLPSKEYPSELENWVGRSEIRKSDGDTMEKITQLLVDHHQDVGRWQFALDQIPLDKLQTKKVKSLISSS